MMLTKPAKIQTTSGVYIFSTNRKLLYIGKALNLKNRVAQYFQNSSRLPPKIQKMLEEATALKTIKTDSEIEALIKEAELIKKHRPKYNALMRDDKNYFFVGITKEDFPRVFITHRPRHELSPIPYSLIPRYVAPRYIGPFTSGGALKETLKLLRRIFPYCTCQGAHKRLCLNSEIGKCPGYCCAVAASSRQLPAISKRRSDYRKNIRSVAAVLMGQRPRLAAELRKRMKTAVKSERYEEAARLRDQVFGLEDIFRHRQTLREQLRRDDIPPAWRDTEWRLKKLLKIQKPIERIEGYDISNIAGKEATGSMVVFRNGVPDKDQYRKFRIKTVPGVSDVGMMKEVLERRFGHPEWPWPQLMVVDGGKAQLNAALKALQKSEIPRPRPSSAEGGRNPKSEIPMVTALAKREEILYTAHGRSIPLRRQDPALFHLFQRIRDESHRFARVYHHRLRKKNFAKSAKP